MSLVHPCDLPDSFHHCPSVSEISSFHRQYSFPTHVCKKSPGCTNTVVLDEVAVLVALAPSVASRCTEGETRFLTVDSQGLEWPPPSLRSLPSHPCPSCAWHLGLTLSLPQRHRAPPCWRVCTFYFLSSQHSFSFPHVTPTFKPRFKVAPQWGILRPLCLN